jgi:predicted XRE-type DNA-binding protein
MCQGFVRHPLDTPEHVSVREDLAREIAELVVARALTQCQAADLLGTTQPKVSALLAGKVEGFSIERLVRYLNLLGQDVHLIVLPKREERPAVHVRTATTARAISAGAWSYA